MIQDLAFKGHTWQNSFPSTMQLSHESKHNVMETYSLVSYILRMDSLQKKYIDKNEEGTGTIRMLI